MGFKKDAFAEIDKLVKNYSEEFSSRRIIPQLYSQVFQDYLQLIAHDISSFLERRDAGPLTGPHGAEQIFSECVAYIKKEFEKSVKDADSTKEWKSYVQRLSKNRLKF